MVEFLVMNNYIGRCKNGVGVFTIDRYLPPAVIGSGGETLNKLQKDSGSTIHIGPGWSTTLST